MLESRMLVLIHGYRVGNGIIGDGGLRVAASAQLACFAEVIIARCSILVSAIGFVCRQIDFSPAQD